SYFSTFLINCSAFSLVVFVSSAIFFCSSFAFCISELYSSISKFTAFKGNSSKGRSGFLSKLVYSLFRETQISLAILIWLICIYSPLNYDILSFFCSSLHNLFSYYYLIHNFIYLISCA